MSDEKRDAAQVAHNHLRQIIGQLRRNDIEAAMEQARFACRVLREMHGAENRPVVSATVSVHELPAPTPRRRKRTP